MKAKFQSLAAMGQTLANKAGHSYREAGIHAVSVVPFLAHAQEAGDPFADAVTDATTKIGTYGAALVGLSAVGVVFMIAMKYVKRIPRAS